jgi:hypothetical protein
MTVVFRVVWRYRAIINQLLNLGYWTKGQYNRGNNFLYSSGSEPNQEPKMKNKLLPLLFAIAAVNLPALSNVARAEGEPAPTTTAAPPAPAAETAEEGDELEMFRFTMRMDKLDFVKKAMALSPEQEKKFLDQYYRYDIELKKLNDERLGIVEDYAENFEKITDKEADKLVKRSIAFRKQRTALLEKYYGKVAKATSKVIAARFLQVESVLQGASDVAIGSSIPLMEK